MAAISELAEASKEFFDMTQSALFSRTLKLNQAGERRLLPLYGAFLQGRFGKVTRELTVRRGQGRKGRIDFQLSNIAIELAVRKPKAQRSALSVYVNREEIRKLLLHDGMAALVLFDYSANPFDDDAIERFRDWPSLGKGNHKTSAFNVIYCSRESGKTSVITKNIRT